MKYLIVILLILTTCKSIEHKSYTGNKTVKEQVMDICRYHIKHHANSFEELTAIKYLMFDIDRKIQE